MTVPWDSEEADPLADILAARDLIANQTGYKAPTLIMSAREKEDYERISAWMEETRRQLESLPRRRWLTRMVLQRQLWGPWWKRSRRLTRLRWRIREWRMGDDWDG